MKGRRVRVWVWGVPVCVYIPRILLERVLLDFDLRRRVPLPDFDRALTCACYKAPACCFLFRNFFAAKKKKRARKTQRGWVRRCSLLACSCFSRRTLLVVLSFPVCPPFSPFPCPFPFLLLSSSTAPPSRPRQSLLRTGRRRRGHHPCRRSRHRPSLRRPCWRACRRCSSCFPRGPTPPSAP